MERLELLDLLLEDPDVVHEGHHPVRGHGRGVQTRGRQQGRDVQRHVALGRVQHKQLRPHQPQQRYLGDKQGQHGQSVLRIKTQSSYNKDSKDVSLPGL